MIVLCGGHGIDIRLRKLMKSSASPENTDKSGNNNTITQQKGYILADDTARLYISL